MTLNLKKKVALTASQMLAENNRATADFMITSPLMNEEYDHQIINFHQNIKERASKL